MNPAASFSNATTAEAGAETATTAAPMKISVAMTTFNGAAYLAEQLDSILAQERLPDEIVVCDDRSSDGTVEMLRRYSATAPIPIKVIVNSTQLGSTKNFEQAIRMCSGDIIALSDQDDVWRPHKLRVIQQRFQDNPSLTLVFTNGDLIDQNGAPLRGSMWSRFKFTPRLRRWLDNAAHSHDLLLSRFFVTGATVAFRSNLRKLCLPFPHGTPTFIHDRWIAVMAAAVGQVEALEERLIAYRLHPQQQMGVGKRPIIYEYLTPYNCSSDGAALNMMRERLRAWPEGASGDFVDALEARRQHIAARAALTGSLPRRVSGILREVRSKRYQRYPLGRGYAVKDLLVGTR